MKRPSFLVVSCMILLVATMSCSGHFHHNINISYSEDDRYYTMHAEFNPEQTGKVHAYMDEKIGKENNMSFRNSRIDGTISLDDKTNFYIKTFPGEVEIKLDKHNNSYESYLRVKKMCEGIKHVLGEQKS